MTFYAAPTSSQSLTEQVADSLRQLGLEIEGDPKSGVVAQIGDHSVILEVERGDEGEVLVRAHMPLDIYVEADSLPDSLMGLNLMNQTLDFGMLLLSPAIDEEEAAESERASSGAGTNSENPVPSTFVIVGRTVLWLSSTANLEVQRLSTHLHRFEAEVFSSLESAVNSAGAMSA